MRHYTYIYISFIGLNIKKTFRDVNVCIEVLQIIKKPPQNPSSYLWSRSVSEHTYTNQFTLTSIGSAQQKGRTASYGFCRF